MFIWTLYNIRLSAFIYLYAPTDMLTIESYFRFTDACLHSHGNCIYRDALVRLVSRKYSDPDAHIYVNIGIHAGCLFSQRDAYIHREFGHPDAHIHVDMGIGVRIFA